MGRGPASVVGMGVVEGGPQSFSQDLRKEFQRLVLLGFPGGTVVGGPPADAGNAGSCPGLGRSHVPWSGWAREPWPLSLRVRSLCSTTGEAAAVRGRRTAKKKKKEKKNYKISLHNY